MSNDVFIYEHDPIEYLGLNTKSFFYRNKTISNWLKEEKSERQFDN